MCIDTKRNDDKMIPVTQTTPAKHGNKQMTVEKATAMKQIEINRHDALVKILTIIEEMKASEEASDFGDADAAVEWIVEKISEED